MLQHRDDYEAKVEESRLAYRSRVYVSALERAKESWPFINGMVQYERKQGRESFSFDGIQIVLKLAPLLFDATSLSELSAFLKSERRTMKFSKDDLNLSLTKAESRLLTCYHLWSFLEQNEHVSVSDLSTHLGCSQETITEVANSWIAMKCLYDITNRTSTRISLTTCMTRKAFGKCSRCGVEVAAEKREFLNGFGCPKCRSNAGFVLTRDTK